MKQIAQKTPASAVVPAMMTAMMLTRIAFIDIYLLWLLWLNIIPSRPVIISRSFDDLIELTFVQPHTPAIWTIIDLNSLTLGHDQRLVTIWTFHCFDLCFLRMVFFFIMMLAFGMLFLPVILTLFPVMLGMPVVFKVIMMLVFDVHFITLSVTRTVVMFRVVVMLPFVMVLPLNMMFLFIIFGLVMMFRMSMMLCMRMLVLIMTVVFRR
nr:hypothetical protein [Mucilaginibacter hurinus]